MKIKRMIALVLAVLLFLFSFVGCAKAPEPDHAEAPEPVVEGPKLADLKATEALVLYIMADYETLALRRINQFTEIYDVDVEIVRVNGDIYAFTERITNDLASGSGPDVLFLDDTYTMDIAKVALNGSFLDLTDILAEDPDFSKDDYLDGVFEACQVNGRQYTIPVSYTIPLTISSKEKLENLGFYWDGIDTIVDFLEEISRLTPDVTQDPGFTQMLYSKNYFDRLLWASGIPLINYETGEVLPDEKGLCEFLEAYKAYFPYDYDGTGGVKFVNYGDRALIAGVCAFWFPQNIDGVTTTMNFMKNKSCDYVIQPIPCQSEGTVGIVDSQIAICANANNSLNAYNFVKFMLSEDAQKDKYTSPSMPIHKEAIREGVYEAPAVKEVGNAAILDTEETALSDEEAEMLSAKLTGIDRFIQKVPQNVTIMVQESMLPYFQDEKSYEECFDDLRNKLTLYLSE